MSKKKKKRREAKSAPVQPLPAASPTWSFKGAAAMMALILMIALVLGVLESVKEALTQ